MPPRLRRIIDGDATAVPFGLAPGLCPGPLPICRIDLTDNFLRLAALPTFALDRRNDGLGRKTVAQGIATRTLFALWRLSRYEHLLWRQARQIVFTLAAPQRRYPARRLSTRMKSPASRAAANAPPAP